MEASEKPSNYLCYFLLRVDLQGEHWCQLPCKFLSVGFGVSWTSILFSPINSFGISPIKMLAFLFLSSVLLSPRSCRSLDGEKVSYRVYHIGMHTVYCSGGSQSPVNLLSLFVELLGVCSVFPFPSPQLIIVKNACFTVYLKLLILSCSKVLQTYCVNYFNCLVPVKNIDYSLEFRL